MSARSVPMLPVSTSGAPSPFKSSTTSAFDTSSGSSRLLSSLKRPVPSFKKSSSLRSSSLTNTRSRSPSPSKSAKATSSLSWIVRGSFSDASLNLPPPSFSSSTFGANSIASARSRSPSPSASPAAAFMHGPARPGGRCVAVTSVYNGSAAAGAPTSAIATAAKVTLRIPITSAGLPDPSRQTARRIPRRPREPSVDDGLRAHDGLCMLVDDDALEPMLLALAHANNQERGHDDEPDDEPPPQAYGPVAEPETEPQAHGHSDAPKADDIDDHRHARVTEAAQQADGDDLQPIEHREHAGKRQQQRCEREHERVVRVEAR